MKHTKGPWEIIPFIESDAEILIRASNYRHCVYAYFARIGGTSDEMKANAHLITAAPDLLDACKIVLERLDKDNAHLQRNKGAMPLEMDVLVAAIAKAEGKQP